MKKYFWPAWIARPRMRAKGPKQPKAAFKSCFRTSNALSNHTCTGIVSHSAYLSQSICPYRCGKWIITPLLKAVCALRHLSYHVPEDLSNNSFDFLETTAGPFSAAFLLQYESCLWRTTLTVAQRGGHHENWEGVWSGGFSRVLWLPLLHWQSMELPEGTSNIMVGKDGHTDVRPVICSLDLWICSFNLGCQEPWMTWVKLRLGIIFLESLAESFYQQHAGTKLYQRNFHGTISLLMKYILPTKCFPGLKPMH